MPPISSRAPIEPLSRLEFSAIAASRAANMPHSKRAAALSKAASGALTSSVLCNILVTPNSKPAFASVIGVAVRPPFRRSRLHVTEWIGVLTDGVTVALRTQYSVEPQPRVCSPNVSNLGSRTATPHLVNAGCNQIRESGPTTPTLPASRPHNRWRRFVLTRALQPTYRGRPSVPQSAWTHQIHRKFQTRPFPPWCADIGDYQVSCNCSTHPHCRK